MGDIAHVGRQKRENMSIADYKIADYIQAFRQTTNY